MYNEEEKLFCRTMHGVIGTIAHQWRGGRIGLGKSQESTVESSIAKVTEKSWLLYRPEQDNLQDQDDQFLLAAECQDSLSLLRCVAHFSHIRP